MSASESIALFYREGSSDKVFNLQLSPQCDGWIVRSQNGRRGSSLVDREVTKGVVAYDVAKKAYNSKLKAKLKDGYTTDHSGSSFASTENAGRVSGLQPQLLNAIDEAQAVALLDDDNWLVQEKFDGVRMMTRKTGSEVTGSNRKGLIVGISSIIEDELARLDFNFEFDGEAVGDTYYIFDVLKINDSDVRDLPFSQRVRFLKGFMDTEHIKFAHTAATRAEKVLLFNEVEHTAGEGVVFKRSAARYTPNRPASGGNALKFKFVETCSVLVKAQNLNKRSVSLVMLHEGKEVDVGNVTIPANHAIPVEGAVCEIRYLYAYQGGSLYQPVYLGLRNDVEASECILDQLKYKSERLAA